MAKKNAGSGWFQKGKEGIDRAKQVDEETKARREEMSGPRRFWLEADTSAKATFLDSPEFFFHEHNLKLSGKWFNYFTCLKDLGTCPLCDSGDVPSYAVAGTVISHKKYEDKDGNEHTNQKQLFVARGKARAKILRQIEKREDLTLCVYEFTRGNSPNESSVGEDMEFVGKLTKAKLESLAPEDTPDNWTEPFDYQDLFKPKDEATLRKLVGLKPPVGSEDENEADEEKGSKSKSKSKSSEKNDDDDTDEKPKDKKKAGKPESIDDLFGILLISLGILGAAPWTIGLLS